jgi:hypothetical protein
LQVVQDDVGGAGADRDVREMEGEARLPLRYDGAELRLGEAVEDDGEWVRRRGRRPSDVGERQRRKLQLSLLRCDWLRQLRALVEQLLPPGAGLVLQVGWEGGEPGFQTGKEILRQD